MDNNYEAFLKDNYECRKVTFEKYKDYINTWECRRGTGARYRKQLRSFLYIYSNYLFKDVDTEYDIIRKFGKGIWDEKNMRRAFNEEEIDKYIVPIAEGYGAFSY